MATCKVASSTQMPRSYNTCASCLSATRPRENAGNATQLTITTCTQLCVGAAARRLAATEQTPRERQPALPGAVQPRAIDGVEGADPARLRRTESLLELRDALVDAQFKQGFGPAETSWIGPFDA